MNEANEKMSRGQWMSTEGRQLYHSWLAELIDRHRLRGDNFHDKRYMTKADDDVRLQLYCFAIDLSNSLMRTDRSTPADKRILFQAKDDLFHYTSVDEFLGEGHSMNAISSHTNDGLEFATRVTYGMALEATKALNIEAENTPAYYGALSGVMSNSSFHTVLEDFSSTGFALLKNDSAHAMSLENPMEKICIAMGIPKLKGSLVEVRQENGVPEFSLNPIIKEWLVTWMRIQNKSHEIDKTGRTQTLLTRLSEKGSFTSGCPVRRAPAGEEKSAIAQLSDYMGEKVQDVIVKRLLEKQVGTLAVTQTMS